MSVDDDGGRRARAREETASSFDDARRDIAREGLGFSVVAATGDARVRGDDAGFERARTLDGSALTFASSFSRGVDADAGASDDISRARDPVTALDRRDANGRNASDSARWHRSGASPPALVFTERPSAPSRVLAPRGRDEAFPIRSRVLALARSPVTPRATAFARSSEP